MRTVCQRGQPRTGIRWLLKLCAAGLLGACVHVAPTPGAADSTSPDFVLSACTWQRLVGVWRSVGYNRLIEIRPDDWTLYHVSTISRIAVERLLPAHFAERYDRIRCNDPNRLVLFEVGGITPYSYTRVAPTGSATYQIDQPDVNARLDDPKTNLAVFWQYFQDNYAFFRAAPVAVDWVAIGTALDARIAQVQSTENLRTAFEDAIRHLKDAHVRLIEGGRQIAVSVPLQDHSFVTEWARTENIDVPNVARGEIFRRFRQAVRDYVSCLTHEPAARIDLQQNLRHGWLTAEIAYIAPLAFVGLTAKVAGSAEDDRLAMHAAMQNVLRDLRSAKGIVVDLRFNGGGHDSVALELVGFFLERPMHVFTKQVWYAGRVVSETPIVLTPSTDAPYRGALAVLVSNTTASAAEIALLAFRQRPQVRFVGQQSKGVLSDSLPAQLPNGWEVTLSNEIYTTPQGERYERVGIPVGVETPPSINGSWRAGLDVSLAAALRELSQMR